LFNQLLLYGAALAATSTHGTVVDLAAESSTADDGDSEATDDRQPGEATTPDDDTAESPPPITGPGRHAQPSNNGAAPRRADGTATPDEAAGEPIAEAAEAERSETGEDEHHDTGANGTTRDHPAGAPDRRR
jgi:hypothetical protein